MIERAVIPSVKVVLDAIWKEGRIIAVEVH